MFALVSAAWRAACQPRLAVALYAASLASAAVPAALGALAFSLVGADRPWAPSPVEPGWANLLLELVAALAAGSGSERRASLAANAWLTAATMLAVPLAALFQWLAYALLAGGILERLRRGSEEHFWPSCRRWFRPFVRLGILGLAAFGAVGLGGAALVGGALDGLGAGVGLVGVALWLSMVDGWLELARAWMLDRDERRAARSLAAATRALAVPRTLPLAVTAWVVLGAVGLALLGLQLAASGLPDWTTSALATQAALLAGAWLQVIRLGVALALVETFGQESGPRR